MLALIEQLEFKRTVDLSDKLEPRVRLSKSEAMPLRATLERVEKEEPRFIEHKADKLEPISHLFLTENDAPTLRKSSTDIDCSIVTPPTTLTPLPSLE
jgi:hypothetical protein